MRLLYRNVGPLAYHIFICNFLTLALALHAILHVELILLNIRQREKKSRCFSAQLCFPEKSILSSRTNRWLFLKLNRRDRRSAKLETLQEQQHQQRQQLRDQQQQQQQQRPIQRQPITVTTASPPISQITERQLRRQHSRTNYHDDEYGPASEVENDRQQRVYRGQPSTIGQVQRDRDGLRRNIISVSPRDLNFFTYYII